MIRIIVACCKDFGIGIDGHIPWNIPEDLQRFRRLTHGCTVVMGRKTFESIGKPLPHRNNIVISRNKSSVIDNNVKYLSMEKAMSLVHAEKSDGKTVWIIGGQEIYRHFLPLADNVEMTFVNSHFNVDCWFPFELMTNFKLKHVEVVAVTAEEAEAKTQSQSHTYLSYYRDCHKHEEYLYLDLLENIMTHGDTRDDRTGVGTISVFGNQMRFDISETVPLLTTKQVPYNMVIKELLWFLRGDTNAKHLQQQGVHIWDGNTSREFLDKRGLHEYQEGDIGPMYGWQWLHFGATYHGCDYPYEGENQGINQLEQVIKMIREDPWSRRIIMSTYNPLDLEKGCLHPCHGLVVQFYVQEIKGLRYLSCSMTQRSADCFLGLPFNIFSYAVLTYIIAAKTGTHPYQLIINTNDTHIYLSHIKAIEDQLSRYNYVRPFPKLLLTPRIGNPETRFSDLTVDDFQVVGYFPHPRITAPMAI